MKKQTNTPTTEEPAIDWTKCKSEDEKRAVRIAAQDLRTRRAAASNERGPRARDYALKTVGTHRDNNDLVTVTFDTETWMDSAHEYVINVKTNAVQKLQNKWA